MARLKYIEAEQASPEVREVYEKTLGGKPGSFQRLLAHRPEVLKTFIPFYSSVGRALERRLYELVYVRVSMINGCEYCLQHHLAGSKRVGVTPQEWQALKNADCSGFSPKEQAALKFAEKLTRQPHSVDDTDFDALKQHFSEEQILDLDALVALINFTNRMTGPLAADLEFAPEKI